MYEAPGCSEQSISFQGVIIVLAAGPREDLSLTRTLLLRILINIISDPRNFLYEICFENWMIVYAWSGSRIGWKALFAFLSIMAMVIALGSQLVGLLITACNL